MKTDISVLLDRSGSMQSIKADTIGGFNEFLKAQKELPGEATLTLVQFDSGGYDRVIDAKPIVQAEPLTDATFLPRGNTPLLDSMARAIRETGERLKVMADASRPEKVVMVIITDGEENSSREFSRDAVMAMVAHQRDTYKWEFIYLGANQDAIKAAASMGIPAAFAASYTGANTKQAYGASSRMVASMRSGGGAAACSLTEDERNAMLAGKT